MSTKTSPEVTGGQSLTGFCIFSFAGMSTKSLPKKGGGGLEFQGLAAPPVFMCLPNVYHRNFQRRNSRISN